MTTLYNRYTSGQGLTLSATFENVAGEAVDPTTVTLEYKDPISGDVTTVTSFVNDETGVYSYDLDTTDFNEGTWYYKWTGTGAVEAAYEWAFVIKHENVA